MCSTKRFPAKLCTFCKGSYDCALFASVSNWLFSSFVFLDHKANHSSILHGVRFVKTLLVGSYDVTNDNVNTVDTLGSCWYWLATSLTSLTGPSTTVSMTW